MNNYANIEGLDPAAVLAALYNRSKQQGMGFSHERGSRQMTLEEAREELKSSTQFDYLHGRVMKISLNKAEMYSGLYNRDVGGNAAEEVIDGLRLNQSGGV